MRATFMLPLLLLAAPALAQPKSEVRPVLSQALPNVPGQASEAFYQSFRQRFAKPTEDYVHLRMQLLVEALAQAIDTAGRSAKPGAAMDMVAVAKALEQAQVTLAGQVGVMRALDHQFQQPLVVGVMDRQGTSGVPFDVEGSGYGFKVVKTLSAQAAEQSSSCKMQRY